MEKSPLPCAPVLVSVPDYSFDGDAGSESFSHDTVRNRRKAQAEKNGENFLNMLFSCRMTGSFMPVFMDRSDFLTFQIPVLLTRDETGRISTLHLRVARILNLREV